VHTLPLSPERVAQKRFIRFWEPSEGDSYSRRLPARFWISWCWHSEHWAHTVTTLVTTTAEWRNVWNRVRTTAEWTFRT